MALLLTEKITRALQAKDGDCTVVLADWLVGPFLSEGEESGTGRCLDKTGLVQSVSDPACVVENLVNVNRARHQQVTRVTAFVTSDVHVYFLRERQAGSGWFSSICLLAACKVDIGGGDRRSGKPSRSGDKANYNMSNFHIGNHITSFWKSQHRLLLLLLVCDILQSGKETARRECQERDLIKGGAKRDRNEGRTTYLAGSKEESVTTMIFKPSESEYLRWMIMFGKEKSR
ncbi:hypothetical protein CBL_00268 [Carabus blaptoides fortunei]